MNKASTAFAALAACAACCIPIVWPTVASVGATGMFASLFAWLHPWLIDFVLCGVAAIALTGWALWLQKRRARESARCGCKGTCQIEATPHRDMD